MISATADVFHFLFILFFFGDQCEKTGNMADVKKHKCDMCPYETSRKSNQQKHVKRVHEKVRPYKCEKCAFETSYKSDLNKHVRGVDGKFVRETSTIPV